MNDTLNNMIGGSIANLSIKDSLDLVPYKDRQVTLTNICSKIMYGGTLEIEGVDYEDIIRAGYRGDIYIEEFNQLVNEKESISGMSNVAMDLEALGFKIITKRRNKYQYYIKAQRKPKE